MYEIKWDGQRIHTRSDLKKYIYCDYAASGVDYSTFFKRFLIFVKRHLHWGNTYWALSLLHKNRVLEYYFNNSSNILYRILYYVHLCFYEIAERNSRCEIPINSIGPGVKFWHFGQGSIIINPKARIGACFSISANCVVGHIRNHVPVLGNFVDMSISSSVLGDIIIPDDTLIGAGAVVVKNVSSSGKTLVGVPARELSRGKSEYERDCRILNISHTINSLF